MDESSEGGGSIMTSYNLRNIEISEVEKCIQAYKYALVYMLSEIILCKTEELQEQSVKNCIEARFFSSEKELHIFETEDGKKAVEVSDRTGEDIIIKKYEIAPRFSKVGKVLVVQEYLEYDEDGQAVIGLTRLKGIE